MEDTNQFAPWLVPGPDVPTEPENRDPGYHIAEIRRGVYGELSKVDEEVAELMDAAQQGVELMVLQELSDVIGAVAGYLELHHPTLSLDDLAAMATVTKRAFVAGHRSPK